MLLLIPAKLEACTDPGCTTMDLQSSTFRSADVLVLKTKG